MKSRWNAIFYYHFDGPRDDRSFKTGISSAVFHSIGNVLLVRDSFVMDVTDGKIAGRLCLITRNFINPRGLVT